MTRTQQIVIQLAASLGQIAQLWTDVVPPEYKLVVAALIGTIQLLAGVIGTAYNPDGTSVRTAYVPDQKLFDVRKYDGRYDENRINPGIDKPNRTNQPDQFND